MYYYTDSPGSTSLLTDSQGNPVTSVHYDPFGNPEITENERYLFTGQERNSTGFNYYNSLLLCIFHGLAALTIPSRGRRSK